MADNVTWQVEQILDGCVVYMGAHRIYYRNGNLQPGVFRVREGDGISVDWEKYSTAEETRQRSKGLEDNAAIRLPVGDVRKTKPLRVEHSPDVERNNRAHGDILGLPSDKPDLTETRLVLLELAVTAIGLDVPES